MPYIDELLESVCDRCKARKQKCSRTRPACESCANLQLFCVYPDSRKRKRTSVSVRQTRQDTDPEPSVLASLISTVKAVVPDRNSAIVQGQREPEGEENDHQTPTCNPTGQQKHTQLNSSLAYDMPEEQRDSEETTTSTDAIRNPSPSDRFLITCHNCVVAPEVDTAPATSSIQDGLSYAARKNSALLEANYEAVNAATILKSRASNSEEIDGDSAIREKEIGSERCNLNSTEGAQPSQGMEVLAYPGSLEELRRKTAASYDCSTLDQYLINQSTDVQPSPDELMKTQTWGHIDPRESWPEERSAGWFAEKQREIAARGGRKENFGKHLTPQAVKERRERGWGIHQNKEATDNEKSKCAAKALEELFQVKNIDNFEPGIRNGQLVMVEKSVDESSGRAKRVYPVRSG